MVLNRFLLDLLVDTTNTDRKVAHTVEESHAVLFEGPADPLTMFIVLRRQ